MAKLINSIYPAVAMAISSGGSIAVMAMKADADAIPVPIPPGMIYRDSQNPVFPFQRRYSSEYVTEAISPARMRRILK